MARKCDICSKAPIFGHNISHAHNVTNRRWTPNIQRVKVRHEGKVRRIRICTRCLRSGKSRKGDLTARGALQWIAPTVSSRWSPWVTDAVSAANLSHV